MAQKDNKKNKTKKLILTLASAISGNIMDRLNLLWYAHVGLWMWIFQYML